MKLFRQLAASIADDPGAPFIFTAPLLISYSSIFSKMVTLFVGSMVIVEDFFSSQCFNVSLLSE